MDGHIPKPLKMDALAVLAAFIEQSREEQEGGEGEEAAEQ